MKLDSIMSAAVLGAAIGLVLAFLYACGCMLMGI